VRKPWRGSGGRWLVWAVLLIIGYRGVTAIVMPLGKVTDMSFQRSFGGRIFGYGEFVVRVGRPGPGSSERHLPAVPGALYRDVCGMLWPARPAPDCKMCNGSGNIVLAEERRLVTATCQRRHARLRDIRLPGRNDPGSSGPAISAARWHSSTANEAFRQRAG